MYFVFNGLICCPKKHLFKTSMVTSDMSLPEQKKICNKHNVTTQAPVKDLFQASTELGASGKTNITNVSNMVSSITMRKVSTKDVVTLLQDSTTLADQGIIKDNNTSSATERATQLGETASLASDKVSTKDNVAPLNDSTNLVN